MQTIGCSCQSSHAPSAHEWDPFLRRLRDAHDAFVATEQGDLGSLEEQLQQDLSELLRLRLEKAAQAKADLVPPRCPKCGRKLAKRVVAEVTVQTRYGPIQVRRTRGWCSKCRAWHCPADQVLNIETGRSPYVQEAAALLATKMPVSEASAVLQRLTGVKLPRATLDRAARQSGQKAQRRRGEKDAQARTGEGVKKLSPRAQQGTLIIEIDAWNIRERDGFGQTEVLRQQGRPPERWHWVWTATVFLLQDRGRTHGERPIILERGFAATRLGCEELKTQIHAEALRRGLGQVERVVVIADGAVWIWNLSQDRFGEAAQRLDFYHAVQHLWAVAEALHGAGTPAAKAWMKPLTRQLKHSQSAKVIRNLEELLPSLPSEKIPAVQKEISYLKNNQARMDYASARRRGEPLGSGAIESTCRQYQCRFKRPGQFWTQSGDEALLCLDTFWRNGRWAELFPHATLLDPSQN
jgi:hypothetical protein